MTTRRWVDHEAATDQFDPVLTLRGIGTSRSDQQTDVRRLWGVQEVAEFLGVPVATLYQWRYRGYGPPGRRVGRYVRYDPEDVRSWFDAQSETGSPAALGR